VIKPISYELEGIVSLLKRTIDKSERGYLVESLWKFLIYTELANTVTQELEAKPAHYVPTPGEQQLLDFVRQHHAIVGESFSVRLQEAVAALASQESTGSSSDDRAQISVLLHQQVLARLRAVLGLALSERERVAILVDNLDKIWGEKEQTEVLSHLLFGLLGIAGRIGDEFKTGGPRKPAANVTLAIFLRSDIFSVIRDVAREPDKISHERIAWNDPELLMRGHCQRAASPLLYWRLCAASST
jgi:hypothetical protein